VYKKAGFSGFFYVQILYDEGFLKEDFYFTINKAYKAN